MWSSGTKWPERRRRVEARAKISRRERKGLKKEAAGAKFGEVSGVIHFYYRAAPAGGRSGKLFLKQSGGLSSELLPARGRGRRRAYRG